MWEYMEVGGFATMDYYRYITLLTKCCCNNYLTEAPKSQTSENWLQKINVHNLSGRCNQEMVYCNGLPWVWPLIWAIDFFIRQKISELWMQKLLLVLFLNTSKRLAEKGLVFMLRQIFKHFMSLIIANLVQRFYEEIFSVVPFWKITGWVNIYN